MAPLPPQATGRVWMDYATGGGVTSLEHTTMLRYSVPLGGDPVGAINALALLITAWGAGNFFDGWQPIRARYAAPASTISLPLALPAALVAFSGSGQLTATPVEQARETAFEGRDPNLGRRVSWSFYGFISSSFSGNDFRIASVGGNIVETFLDVLDEVDGAYFVTVGGSRATAQPYCNWQFNSYWERRQRA